MVEAALDLKVTNDGSGVTLNFGDAPERLYVPYDSIQTFVDPSVEFGLRFETLEVDDDIDELDDTDPPDDDPSPGKAEVVRLDSFRK